MDPLPAVELRLLLDP